MKILIASDAHDRFDNLTRAIEIGNAAGCEIMLFAGDFMSVEGIDTFEKFNGPVHFVFGNNDNGMVSFACASKIYKNVTFHYHHGESVFKEEINGLSFYMNHYPEFVVNAARTGKYDVCVCGHYHIYHEEVLENGTLLLNPGEIMGRKGTPTFMIFDTATKGVEKVEIL